MDIKTKLHEYDNRRDILEIQKKKLQDLQATHFEKTKADFGIADGELVNISNLAELIKHFGGL